MTRIVFQEVIANGVKVGKCTGCGKHMRRQRKFINTINPFNKNPDGTMKSAAQVRKNVDRICAEWESEPLTHEQCKDLQRG